MSYFKYNLKLTDGQKQKLLQSYQKRVPLTLRLKNNQLSGNDEVFLTKTQVNRIEKSKRGGTGTDIKISQAGIRKQEGCSIISSLMPMMSMVGAMALPWLSKAAAPLVTGALSGLSSLGVNKLFGNGIFSIPQNKVNKLIQYKDYLTTPQKKQIVDALQTGSGIDQFKVTKKQFHGSGLGMLLALIGVPRLINALTGKGLQVGPSGFRSRRNVYVPRPTPPKKPRSTPKSKGGLVLPYQPPPFIGTWEAPVGMGVKKPKKKKRLRRKKGDGLLLGKKQSIQWHSTPRSPSIRFINKALSNIDILDWVDKLGIKHFRGVYSRDNLPAKMNKKECGIINLDSQIGPGTHWVCYRNIDKYCEYFDSFGLPMPEEVLTYLSTGGKQIIYSRDEIQERNSVLCGYWCLYFLYERQRGISFLNTIHNPQFNPVDHRVSHNFLMNNFKAL